MRDDKKPPRKLKKLTEFISKEKSIPEERPHSIKEERQDTSLTTQEVYPTSQHEDKTQSYSQTTDISDELILQLLSRIEQVERKPETSMATDKTQKEEKEASIPNEEIAQEMMDQLIKEGIKIVECSSSRICNDGVKVGDIFVDAHGIKRQRGYLKTTRIPIYVDVIVEAGNVKQIPGLKKTFLVTTSRGARAIIPEEFLCELEERYGVILEGYNCEKTGLLGGLDVSPKKQG